MRDSNLKALAIPSWLAAAVLCVSRQRLATLSLRPGWRIYFPTGAYLISVSRVLEYIEAREERADRAGAPRPDSKTALLEVLENAN